MTKLTGEQVNTLCRPGQGAATCSFLLMAPRAGWTCAKGTEFEKILAERRQYRRMRALGDNCSGAPEFRILQPPVLQERQP